MYRISDLIQNYKYVDLYVSAKSVPSIQQQMSGLYKVQRIVGKRIRDGTTVQYKVKWKNYDSSQNTWQPLKNLRNIEEMIKEFEMRNKDKIPQLPQQRFQGKNGRSTPIVQNKSDLKTVQKTISKSNDTINSTKRQAGRPLKKNIAQKKTNPRTNSSDNEQNQEDLNLSTKDIQKVESHSQNIHLDEHILELNLNNIASKIIVAAQDKQKTYQIIDIQKRSAEEGDLYVVEDSEGNKQHRTRQDVLKNLALQLVAFYEKKVKFAPAIQ